MPSQPTPCNHTALYHTLDLVLQHFPVRIRWQIIILEDCKLRCFKVSQAPVMTESGNIVLPHATCRMQEVDLQCCACCDSREALERICQYLLVVLQLGQKTDGKRTAARESPPASVVGLTWIRAATCSPKRGCGIPTTAACWISGWCMRTCESRMVFTRILITQ